MNKIASRIIALDDTLDDIIEARRERLSIELSNDPELRRRHGDGDGSGAGLLRTGASAAALGAAGYGAYRGGRAFVNEYGKTEKYKRGAHGVVTKEERSRKSRAKEAGGRLKNRAIGAARSKTNAGIRKMAGYINRLRGRNIGPR